MSEELSVPKLIVQVVFGFIIYGALFFVPAGTLEWPEAWIFLILSFSYVIIVIVYFSKRDPTIIQSRSSIKPEKSFDVLLLVGLGLAFFSMFLITAFNVRFELPRLDLIWEIIGFIGVILAYFIIFLVMRENAYASKVIEVQEGQKVISTGPYAYVRHPMYAGFLFMCVGFPLALGALLALPSGIIAIILMAIRAYYEEKTLIEDLEGYKEYTQKVRYRLIPKVW